LHPLILLPIGLVGFLTGLSLGTGRKGLTMLPKSPLPDVSQRCWLRYTVIMARRPKAWQSPRGRLGTFDMDARRLADVGLMMSPRKTTIGRETGVWTGDWKAPLSESIYLKSMPLQYVSFTRSMTAMVPKVNKFIGETVDGKVCTLSGLLGVGHLAGEAGVESWVKDPKVREKFKATTDTFNRVNGVF
jgi:hypothetical protein